MTESEYKKQSERLGKYKNAQDRISVIERKKSIIENGILSINCDYDKNIDFDYLGDGFKQKLVETITSFLESEIEEIKKSMEDI